MWIIFILAYLIMAVSWGMLTRIAFKESVNCGLMFIFVPLYAVYYIATRWETCSYMVYIHLTGLLINIIVLL